MPTPRMPRVNELIQHELAQILNYDLNDPRVGFVTVTNVSVSKDLRQALVLISVMDDDNQVCAETLNALESAKGYIKRLLSERVALKRLPDLHFREDNTLKRAMRIDALLHQDEKTRQDTSPETADPDGE